MIMNTMIFVASLVLVTSACKTTETGGKVVDRNRGEIVISSSGDQRSALPEASKDSSLTEARSNLEKATTENPKDVSLLLSLAQLQLAQDQFSAADATCQKVLRLDIKNQEARKVLAQAAIRQGNPDKAMIFLTALGGEQSRDSSVLNMLALVSMSRHDSTEAMRLWKHALTLNANDISARMNLGVMYIKYRLLGQASAQFERILKVAPNHQDAMLHLAVIEASRGKHEQSIEVYTKILKGDETNPLALYNLAVSQKAMQQYDDALDSLKYYIKASAAKSAQTDQAFAMMDEINLIKQSKGDKVSDSDIRALAASLESKRPPARGEAKDLSPARATETVAAPVAAAAGSAPTKAATKPSETSNAAAKARSNDLGADKDVDELERELKAH